MITQKGYDLMEVASALQKSVRRGNEDEAMYWAVELFQSGYAEYCWKRLRIMASEDIGLAEPGLVADLWALYEMHREQAKKKDDANEPQRLFLTHAVLLMCRARKSRLVDWTLIHYWRTHELTWRPIPDYAFDKHNQRGRQLGRGWGHFFDEGTRLSPMGDVHGENEAKERARKAIEQGKPTQLFPDE